MIYLLVLLLVIPSPIFIVFNSEVIAVVLGLKGHPFWLVALCLATGQTIGFSLLYFFGRWFCDRWQALAKKLDSFNLSRFKEKSDYFLCAGALTGLPPLNVMSILAPKVGVPFYKISMITFSFRLLRYLILAGIPQFFAPYLNLEALPAWLNP